MLTQGTTHSTTTHQESDAMNLIGCPTCGRPAEVRSQLFDTELACRHCSATFVVTELMDCSKLARSMTAIKSQCESKQRVVKSSDILGGQTMRSTRSESKPHAEIYRPIAFLIDPRDEIYARLAGDLIEAGYRPVRALSVTDALKACGKYRPSLVLVSIGQTEKAAWQMAPKLAMLDARMRIWLYDHQVEVHDYAMADFLGIEQLIEYGGDLFVLSSLVRELLGFFGSKTGTPTVPLSHSHTNGANRCDHRCTSSQSTSQENGTNSC